MGNTSKEKAEQSALEAKEAATNETEAEIPVPKVLTTKDPEYWEELVDYMPFYDGRYYVDDIDVTVNGERIIIKRDIDEPVKIKRKFLQAIKDAEKQEAAANRYSAQKQNKNDD